MLGGAALGVVAGVRTAVLGAVARAGVGGAVKGGNVQVTRHDGSVDLSVKDINGQIARYGKVLSCVKIKEEMRKDA